MCNWILNPAVECRSRSTIALDKIQFFLVHQMLRGCSFDFAQKVNVIMTYICENWTFYWSYENIKIILLNYIHFQICYLIKLFLWYLWRCSCISMYHISSMECMYSFWLLLTDRIQASVDSQFAYLCDIITSNAAK